METKFTKSLDLAVDEDVKNGVKLAKVSVAGRQTPERRRTGMLDEECPDHLGTGLQDFDTKRDAFGEVGHLRERHSVVQPWDVPTVAHRPEQFDDLLKE